MSAARYEELARGALLEITGEGTIGSYVGEVEDGGATAVLFESTLAGYPGWRWTVAVAEVEGEEPTVLEAELMPADGALLAPDWVPWSDRLAEYKAAQEALEADAETDDEDDEDDVLGSDVLHGGDLDGVDIDEQDIDDDDDDDDDDEEDDEFDDVDEEDE